MDYETYGGREIFLSYEDKNETLFGLLRMRVKPSLGNGNLALIRELHIFGPEVPLGEKRKEAAQHRGLGGKLLREAERIAQREFLVGKLSVLSGVGSREYYRSLGYILEGVYMVKELA